MIDTDRYEGTNWDLRGQFTHTEMADEVLLLLAEVERLRGLLDAIHWDAFAEDDTTLEIDREVAERIRRGD